MTLGRVAPGDQRGWQESGPDRERAVGWNGVRPGVSAVAPTPPAFLAGHCVDYGTGRKTDLRAAFREDEGSIPVDEEQYGPACCWTVAAAVFRAQCPNGRSEPDWSCSFD